MDDDEESPESSTKGDKASHLSSLSDHVDPRDLTPPSAWFPPELVGCTSPTWVQGLAKSEMVRCCSGSASCRPKPN